MRLFFYFFRWIIGSLIFLFILWQVFVFLRPAPRIYDAAELRAVSVAIENFVDDVEMALAQRNVRVGVVGLLGDSSGQAAETLRAAVDKRRSMSLETAGVPRAFIRDVGNALADASTLEDVFSAAGKVGMDVLLAGKIQSVERLASGGARSSIELNAWDLQAGEWLVRRTAEADWHPGFGDRMITVFTSAPAWQRTLLWLLIVGLLPWLTAFFPRWARDRRSNYAAALMLASYILVALFLAAAFTGFRATTMGDWLALLSAFAISGVYSYWAAERIVAKN